MKKYTQVFLFMVFNSLATASALTPLVDSSYSNNIYAQPQYSSFFQVVEAISIPAMIFLAFSQIIIFSYLSYILYSVYISKKISMEGLRKVAVTIFAAFYCSSFLSMLCFFTSNWARYN